MSKMFFRQTTDRASPAGDAPQAVLLDDDLDHRMSQVLRLAEAGYVVIIVGDLPGALSVIERDSPCLAIFHQRRIDTASAVRAAQQARALRPGLRIIEEMAAGDLDPAFFPS